MANRLFQGIIHQMTDTVDRTIGVIDENGVIIACSELVKIGETRQEAKDELAYSTGTVIAGGYTYRPIGQGTKWEFSAFRHKERFCCNTNSAITCKNCTEKVCPHQKRLKKLNAKKQANDKKVNV